jgi:hypothetical protein
MKVQLKLALTFILSVIIVACSSGIRVSQDFEQGFDFTTLKTYDWAPNEDNAWGLQGNDLVDRRIRNAIVNFLTSRGHRQDSEQPDFYISYDLAVEQRISSSNVSGGVSVGRSTRGRHGSIGLSTGSQVRTYDEGTLIIDITDVASGKLVWRGVSSQALPDLSDPETLTNQINATVAAILAQYPPKSK